MSPGQVSRAGSHEATISFILEDPGSRDNVIIHAFTYQAGSYKFQIKDMTKGKHIFNAIGVDKIASIDKASQAQKLAQWFLGVSTIARQAFGRPY